MRTTITLACFGERDNDVSPKASGSCISPAPESTLALRVKVGVGHSGGRTLIAKPEPQTDAILGKDGALVMLTERSRAAKGRVDPQCEVTIRSRWSLMTVWT